MAEERLLGKNTNSNHGMNLMNQYLKYLRASMKESIFGDEKAMLAFEVFTWAISILIVFIGFLDALRRLL